MTRIDKMDERYHMLSRLPRIVDGRVAFRKKPNQCRYLLCVIDLDDTLVSVFYKINKKSTDDMGNKCTRLTFEHCEKK